MMVDVLRVIANEGALNDYSALTGHVARTTRLFA